jgi:two-component system, chemotaxis family, chemotaxis protein CheY
MSKNVLVVDDSPITQKQLVKIVQDGGYTVVGVVGSGDEAIKVFDAQKDSIDLITLDITMPGLDGISVLKYIMSVKQDVNVVMISVIGKDSIIKECMELGAKYFVTKPFVKDKVLEIFKDCLEKK